MRRIYGGYQHKAYSEHAKQIELRPKLSLGSAGIRGPRQVSPIPAHIWQPTPESAFQSAMPKPRKPMARQLSDEGSHSR